MEEIPGVLFLILVVITVNRKYDEMFDLYKNSLKLEGINYSFYSFEYKQPKKKYRIEIICTNKQKNLSLYVVYGQRNRRKMLIF